MTTTINSEVQEILTAGGLYVGDPAERARMAVEAIALHVQHEETRLLLESLVVYPPGESPQEKANRALAEIIGDTSIPVDLDTLHEWDMRGGVLSHLEECPAEVTGA